MVECCECGNEPAGPIKREISEVAERQAACQGLRCLLFAVCKFRVIILNKAGNVRINVTLRRVRVTIVSVEKQ
jgi:hypothetical protein